MAAIDTRKHPVWDVYDELRTARLSLIYFSKRLASLERKHFWLELVLAGTASGSAIAALTFWQTNEGKQLWTALTILSAVLAVAKPIIKLTERIQKVEQVLIRYKLLDHDYRKLELLISQAGKYEAAHQAQFRLLLDRGSELKKLELVERRIDPKLRLRCRAEVDKELPLTNFFIPEM